MPTDPQGYHTSETLRVVLARLYNNDVAEDADVDAAVANINALIADTTAEAVQDKVASLLTHSGHTNISATYQDDFNRIDLSVLAGSTDRTAPLKYTAFLAAANGDHQAAFQNAFNALYATTGNYRRVLDLEGALVILRDKVTPPTTFPNDSRTIRDGEIRVDDLVWPATSNYMIEFSGTGLQQLRLDKVNMNGRGVASWMIWDEGDMRFLHCDLKNPKKGGAAGVTGPPGLNCNGAASAGLWVHGGRWSSDEPQTIPTDRQTIAIRVASGDNKFFENTASYFKHWLVAESGAYLINSCHPFQGQTGGGALDNVTSHSASIKLTSGYTSTTINNLYLGKSFIEMSNETNATTTSIGGLTIAGMRAYVDNGETSFAFIQARDYHNNTSLVLEDISVTASNFVNRGTTTALVTRIRTLGNFNILGMRNVMFQGNTFDGAVAPEANPVRLTKTVSGVLQTTFDYSTLFPFSARPQHVLNVGVRRTSATQRQVDVGNIDTALRTVRVDISNTDWAGTLVCTATCNASQSAGFLDG